MRESLSMLWLLAALGSPVGLANTSAEIRHLVHIEGSGARTVLFESGVGDTLDIWQALQARVAGHCAKTFSYNRAGYLGSDVAIGPRDAATIVEELHGELQRRQLTPPYVLVGHSLGGLYMQYFARNFPSEVVGLLLIDSTASRQELAIDATANTPYQSRTAVTLYMPLIMRRELTDSSAAGREVDASPHATPIPTVVLSSTRPGRGVSAEQFAQSAALQNEIAADYPQVRHEFVADSGHYIQRDQPNSVIAAIRELAGCERTPPSR